MQKKLTRHMRFYALVHWIAKSHWLRIFFGLLVASFGVVDLFEMEKGAVVISFNSTLGLILAGLQQVCFGLTNLLLGTRLVGLGFLGAEHIAYPPSINRILKGYVENPYLAFGLGLSLLAIVCVEAWQDWILGGVGQKRSIWYFGLGLLALLTIARSLESVIMGLGLMAEGESKGHFVLKLAHQANIYVRKRWLLIGVAIICVGLGLAEEFFITANNNDNRKLIAHHGFLLFALLEASRLLPIIYPPAVLADEGLTTPDRDS